MTWNKQLSQRKNAAARTTKPLTASGEAKNPSQNPPRQENTSSSNRKIATAKFTIALHGNRFAQPLHRRAHKSKSPQI